MKTFTVMNYLLTCQEWYHVEAETEDEAMQKIMENPERVPDHEYTIKGSDFDASEEGGQQ